MTKKIAVAVIHGMGSQGLVRPANSEVPSFSRDLRKSVRRVMGPAKFDADVAWREIFWSHIMEEREKDYLAKIRPLTGAEKSANSC